MKIKTHLLLFVFVILSFSCGDKNKSKTPEIKAGMVKVTILYPNGEGNTFNMDYYTNNHMPMVADLLGDSLKLFKIDKGIAGRGPDELAPYLAIGYLYFDKLSDYRNSFAANGDKIVNDIPNYTNVRPIIQISEIVK